MANVETCGDCADGRCHGGSEQCGCALHDASVRPEPLFIPRVFISDKGSVAIEEPGRLDYARIVRIAEDLRPAFPDMRDDVPTFLPIEALMCAPHMGWRFREMVPRGY